MKQILFEVTLAILLLVITDTQFSNITMANFTPNDVFFPAIIINSNGTISPEMGYIYRTGSDYFLTCDMSNYSLVIQCSNITLDGKGHIINGTLSSPYETLSVGLSLDHVTNVTVKDLEIAGFNNYDAVRIRNCSVCSIVRVKASTVNLQGGSANSILESTINWSMDIEGSQDNTITKNVIGRLALSGSNNNLVTENNITNIIVQFCDSNKYYTNNFLSPNNSFQYYFSNKESFWDNGSIGNYWLDYLTRFPNASEIGNSGIGNTPYEINQVNQAWINGEYVNVTWILGHVIDHYPLLKPITIERDLPSYSPSPSIAPASSAITLTIMLLIGITTVTIILAVLLSYITIRKRTIQTRNGT